MNILVIFKGTITIIIIFMNQLQYYEISTHIDFICEQKTADTTELFFIDI